MSYSPPWGHAWRSTHGGRRDNESNTVKSVEFAQRTDKERRSFFAAFGFSRKGKVKVACTEQQP